jgi:hypothetical protein
MQNQTTFPVASSAEESYWMMIFIYTEYEKQVAWKWLPIESDIFNNFHVNSAKSSRTKTNPF